MSNTMKPGRRLYLKLMDYFHGILDDYENDMQQIKRMIEECFGEGAADP